MDGFFEFAEDGGDYPDDDSMARDNLSHLDDPDYGGALEFDEEDYMDGINRIPINQTIAVVGAMMETEAITPLQTEVTKEVKRYISLAEARDIPGGKRPKRPLRPFEQFVQDVLSGKKSITDPL